MICLLFLVCSFISLILILILWRHLCLVLFVVLISLTRRHRRLCHCAGRLFVVLVLVLVVRLHVCPPSNMMSVISDILQMMSLRHLLLLLALLAMMAATTVEVALSIPCPMNPAGRY